MANTRASQRKEEEAKKLMEQKEGSIASRLRSRLKIEGANANTYNTEKKSQTVTVRKNNSVEEKNENDSAKRKGFAAPHQGKTAFTSKKATLISTKEPSKVTISHDVDKKKEKATPTQQKINPNPIYYIKFKGFEERQLRWSCGLCEESLRGEEEAKQENELRYSLYSHYHEEEEEELVSLLPEVAVLPCTHVFHNTCLSTLYSANVNDPTCPICLSMLSI